MTKPNKKNSFKADLDAFNDSIVAATNSAKNEQTEEYIFNQKYNEFFERFFKAFNSNKKDISAAASSGKARYEFYIGYNFDSYSYGEDYYDYSNGDHSDEYKKFITKCGKKIREEYFNKDMKIDFTINDDDVSHDVLVSLNWEKDEEIKTNYDDLIKDVHSFGDMLFNKRIEVMTNASVAINLNGEDEKFYKEFVKMFFDIFEPHKSYMQEDYYAGKYYYSIHSKDRELSANSSNVIDGKVFNKILNRKEFLDKLVHDFFSGSLKMSYKFSKTNYYYKDIFDDIIEITFTW